MFLIRLKIIGNCIMTDLDDLVIYDNRNIIDIEEYVSTDKIKKSMIHSQEYYGDLCRMIDNGLIELVSENSIEYKKQQREKERQKKPTNRNVASIKTFAETIQDLKTINYEESYNLVSTKYFDNLSILDRVIHDDGFSKQMKDLAKKLMNDNLNNEIDKRFVLL